MPIKEIHTEEAEGYEIPVNGNLPVNRTKFVLQELKQVHYDIAMLVFQAFKDKEIAEQVGVSAQMVRYTRESPMVIAMVDHWRTVSLSEGIEVKKEIDALQPAAVLTLSHLMVNPMVKDSVRSQIARDMLDRGGHGAVKATEIPTDELTATEIQQIKERAGLIKVTEVEYEVQDANES